MNSHEPVFALIDVVRVEPRGGYRLVLAFFSDGSEGERDFADLVAEGGEMVEPLRRGCFARVFLDDGVPTWPNGFDLDPIALHQEMKAAGLLRAPAA